MIKASDIEQRDIHTLAGKMMESLTDNVDLDNVDILENIEGTLYGELVTILDRAFKYPEYKQHH